MGDVTIEVQLNAGNTVEVQLNGGNTIEVQPNIVNTIEIVRTVIGTSGKNLASIIVDTYDDLPETAEQGQIATVRLVEQDIVSWECIDEYYGTGSAGQFLTSIAFSHIYFHPTPPRPNWTELGIESQMLVSGWSSLYGQISPINNADEYSRHWHIPYECDKYDMLFVPACEVFPVDVLIFNDLTVVSQRMKYIYIWDEVEENEEGVVQGWNIVTEYDESNNPIHFMGVSELPPILAPSAGYFYFNDNGVASQTYFGKMCNPNPFKMRQYVYDNGWIDANGLGAGESGQNGVDGTNGLDGASIITAEFSGNDILFTKDDSTTVTLEDAKIELKGADGLNGTNGTNGLNGQDGTYPYDYEPENVANKTTYLTNDSTDIEYPSAKTVYDLLGTVMVSVVGSEADLPIENTPEGKLAYVYGATAPDIDAYIIGDVFTMLYMNPNPPEPDVLFPLLSVDNIYVKTTVGSNAHFELYAYKDGALGHQFVQFRYIDNLGFVDHDNYASAQIFTWVWQDDAQDYIAFGEIANQNYVKGCNRSVVSKSAGVYTITTPTAPRVYNYLSAFGISSMYIDEESEGIDALGYYIKSTTFTKFSGGNTYSSIYINPAPINPIVDMHAYLKCGEAKTHIIDVYAKASTPTAPYFVYYKDNQVGTAEYTVYANDDWTGDLVSSGTNQAYLVGWNTFTITGGIQSAVTQISSSNLPYWAEIWEITHANSSNYDILGDYVSELPLDGAGLSATFIYQSLQWKPLTDISSKEDKSNKVTTITAGSTNVQYPSAKAVYDAIDSIEGGIGEDGKSAYEIWIDLGNTGTEQEFIDSLQGENGTNGSNGTNGTNGTNGADGLTTSVNNVTQVNGNVSIDTDDIPATATNRYVPTIPSNPTTNYLNGNGSFTTITPFYTGTCGTASATVAKEVTISNYTLNTGDILAITYTSGSSASAPTLAINGGTAYNIRLNGTNANTTVHYINAGGVVQYYFSGSNFEMFGSAKTTDSNDIWLDSWQANTTVGVNYYSYKLSMQATDGKLYPFTLETGIGTTKTVSTQEYLINSPIFFYPSTATLNANDNSVNFYVEYLMLNHLRYTANVATMTDQQNVYLKGTITATGGFKLDNTSYTSWLTQTLPTSDDGFVYMYLGYMYSTTNMRLFQDHPIYQFKQGKLQQYTPNGFSSVLTPEIKTDTSSATDLTITNGANKTVVLATAVYDDLQVGINNVAKGSSAPTNRLYNHGIGSGIEYNVLGFAKDNFVLFDVQTPHSMKLNTTLGVHIHFTLPNTTTVGHKIVWQLDVVYADIDGTWVVPTGSPFTTTYTVATDDNTKHRIFNVGLIPAVNAGVSTVYKCKLTRIDGTATEYGSEVYVEYIDCHYQKDTLGSRQETVK